MNSSGIQVIKASPEYAAAVKQAMGECTGMHHFYVAETAAAEGKVFVLIVCTACGAAKKHEFAVAAPSSVITLKSDK